MASRILACLLFLAFTAPATEDSGWRFYPINTDYVHGGHVSGLELHFVNQPGDTARISATVIDCGQERQVSGEVPTAGPRTEPPIFQFPIKSLDGFRVTAITMSVGKSTATIKDPRAGELYRF